MIQQEVEKEGKWTPLSNPELKKTKGCLRAFEKDMIAFKSITDELQKKDSEEVPGLVTILDDLERKVTPHPTKYVETVSTYKLPEKKKDPWEEYLENIFDNFNNYYNW